LFRKRKVRVRVRVLYIILQIENGMKKEDFSLIISCDYKVCWDNIDETATTN